MKYVATISILVVALAASHAHASMITFTTPEDSLMNEQPVSAQATFTTSLDTVTIFLENLQVDPTSVTQNVSGILFLISTGESEGTGLPRFFGPVVMREPLPCHSFRCLAA
jgi:hypothetical protein